MTADTAPAVAPGPAAAGPGAQPGRTRHTFLRSTRDWAGLLPFGVYVGLGLILPTIAIIIGAFQTDDGAWTLSNLNVALHGVYLHGLEVSLELSVVTAIIPGIIGFLIAYAIFTARRGSVLRRVTITASGTFANFGGVPLAFLFIATLGTTGLLTGWLSAIGLNPYDHGFNLYTFSGVALVYMYFQIPLMVLVILPSLEGLRPAWREAASNLGANSWQYWRHVGGPVLWPAFLSCVLLLFGSALAAYATAQALTSGSIPLTSIQIGTFLNGNVLAGQTNVGKALALLMVLIIAVAMSLYGLAQRRAAKWLQ